MCTTMKFGYSPLSELAEVIGNIHENPELPGER